MRESKPLPNIILIMTDQQRYDTIRDSGADWMITPHLNKLVQGGLSLERCYCAAPVCVPSRASFFNANYPHQLGVYSNQSRWGNSWVSQLQAAGYHTVNIGKMHTVPFDAQCGFDQRFVVENKDRPIRLDRPHGGYYDEWDKYLRHRRVEKPSRWTYQERHPDYASALGAYTWPLDEEYHPDVFVGQMARWFLQERQAATPLFLQIGFPGPHPPYDPPERFLEMYSQVNIPIPEVSSDELMRQPPPYAFLRQEMIDGNHDAVRWSANPSPEQLLRLRRHYAANVTLIDEQIGAILAALIEKGYLENAIVLFTSDHGDCLGDHRLVQKWNMYESVVRVPAVIWALGRLDAGVRLGGLVQQFDLAPTLFELAGLTFKGEGPACSILPGITSACERTFITAELTPDNILKGVNFVTMLRTQTHKLVHFLDQPFGELYDLVNDSMEVNNLWGQPASAGIQQELENMLRDWLIRENIKKGSLL